MTNVPEKKETRLDRGLSAEGINYVAGLVTIGGAVTNAIFTGYLGYRLLQGAGQQEELILQLLLFPSVMSMALLLILTFVSWSYRRKIIKIGEKDAELARFEAERSEAVNFNREISRYRTSVAHAHYDFCTALHQCTTQLDPAGLDHKLETYLDRVLDNTAKLFTRYTDDQCSACIKIFTKGPDGAYATTREIEEAPAEFVRTLRRDPSSRDFRREVDADSSCAIYKYRKNAAFFKIVDQPEEPDYYIQNDLKSLGKLYWNENKRWQQYYNATAVVPIKQPDKSADRQCAALLCVDNKAGRFDEGRCLYILQGIAIDVYYALRTYLVLVDQSQRGVSHG